MKAILCLREVELVIWIMGYRHLDLDYEKFCLNISYHDLGYVFSSTWQCSYLQGMANTACIPPVDIIWLMNGF